tara:strand:- start:5722 stop:7470 length:1749 start_codon:yes stop_codon:yes gene_type:complete
MKLYILGLLIIIGILSIVYICNNLKENMDGEKENEKIFIKDQINYYKGRQIPEFEKGLDDATKFIKVVEGMDIKLKEEKKTGTIDENETTKNIEKCKTFNKINSGDSICNNLDNTSCGYCHSSNRVMYGDKDGPITDVCLSGWVPPGASTEDICTKMKERSKCGKIKDCGEATGVCGWCPITQKGMPAKEKGDGYIPKYSEDECNWLGQSYKGGTLIKSDMCGDLGEQFPCIGKNALGNNPEIGHSDKCINDLWKKSTCTGDINTRYSESNKNISEERKKWNKMSYIDLGNLFKGIFKLTKEGGDEDKYKIVNQNNKLCFGEEIDPCEDKFNPRPLECLNKVYNLTGCSKEGKLNPEHGTKYIGNGISQGWYNNSKGGVSVEQYKRNILSYKSEADSFKRNPKSNYNRAIYTNELCYGSFPKYPGEKLCWNDFKERMLSHTEVYLDNGDSLNFNNSVANFKTILPWNQITLPQPFKFEWNNNYTINKQLYDMPNFPYWKFLKVSKDYWNNNWLKFKNNMLMLPEITSNNNDNIDIKNEGIFKNVLEANNLNGSNKSTIITKSEFSSEKFPYWDFIRVWKANK